MYSHCLLLAPERTPGARKSILRCRISEKQSGGTFATV